MDSDSSQSCSLCRHEGNICHEECEYRQIFPGDRYQEFENAKRLFGVKNMVEIIQSVGAHERKAAADSMFLEANAWRNHPVHGPLGFASDLISQIQSLFNQLQAAKQQLEIFRHHQHLPVSPSSLPFSTSRPSEIHSIMGEIFSCEEVKPMDVQQITSLLEYYRRGRGRRMGNETKMQDRDQRNAAGRDGEIDNAEVSENEN